VKQENMYGVWANKDSELVITPKLILFFGRKDHLIVVSVLHRNEPTAYSCYQMVKLIQFDSLAKKYTEQNLDQCSAKMSIGLNSSDVSDGSSIFFSNVNLEFNFKFWGKGLLLPVEKLKVIQPSSLPQANLENIGHCLQAWNLMAILQQDENTFALRINTNKHLYEVQCGYHETYGQVIYCHASHIKTCNQGMVFNQYIRLLHNSFEFSAQMNPDNFAKAVKDIELNYTLFNRDKCNITQDSGVYWSVKSFQPDEIILNQCDGDMSYNRYPPEMLVEAGAECFDLTV